MRLMASVLPLERTVLEFSGATMKLRSIHGVDKRLIVWLSWGVLEIKFVLLKRIVLDCSLLT